MSLDRKRALILLGIATVAFTVILELIDPSHVSRGPTILDFEFAGSQPRATQIIAEWGAKGRSAAHLSLVLDYGYMLSHGLFFVLADFAVRDTAEHAAGRGAEGAIATKLPLSRMAASRLRPSPFSNQSGRPVQVGLNSGFRAFLQTVCKRRTALKPGLKPGETMGAGRVLDYACWTCRNERRPVLRRTGDLKVLTDEDVVRAASAE